MLDAEAHLGRTDRSPQHPRRCGAVRHQRDAMGLYDLAFAARPRAVELRAAAHGAETDAEREALEAVYVYEKARSTPRRKFHASRTWQMIDRCGIISAVERVVSRPDDSMGYEALVKAGM